MNVTENYEAAATGARAALDAAKAIPTVETYRHAASLLLAAGVLARACGNATEMRAHNAAGREAMVAANKLENGEALEASLEGHPFGGNEWMDIGDAGRTMMNTKSGSYHVTPIGSSGTSFNLEHKTDFGTTSKVKNLGNFDTPKAAKSAAFEHAKGFMEASNALTTDALSAAAASRMATDTELQAALSADSISYNDMQDSLRKLCQDVPALGAITQNQCGGIGGCCYVADIELPKHETGESWTAIVSASDGKLYAQQFKIGDEGKVTLDGDPKQVERVTDYDYVFNPEKAKPVAAANGTVAEALEAGTSEGVRKAWETRHAAMYSDVEKLAEEKSGNADYSTRQADRQKAKYGTPHQDTEHAAARANTIAAEYHKMASGVATTAGETGRAKRHLEVAAEHTKTAVGHLKNIPESYQASAATETAALSASRASEATANRYKNAAAEAQGASGSIKETHKKAMHLHKIAAECAGMCDDDVAKGKHEAMAQKHGAALEADYDMPMDMAASNAATAAALEAGGPGSGPRPKGLHYGDETEYTGKKNKDDMHEMEIMEGHKKGQMVYTARGPDGKSPYDERGKKEWEQQQAEFRRLRENQK